MAWVIVNEIVYDISFGQTIIPSRSQLQGQFRARQDNPILENPKY
jgi:hypothetical protein